MYNVDIFWFYYEIIRANKRASCRSLLTVTSWPWEPPHFICISTQEHKHVTPVSLARYRPWHIKAPQLLWMMMVLLLFVTVCRFCAVYEPNVDSYEVFCFNNVDNFIVSKVFAKIWVFHGYLLYLYEKGETEY